MYGCTGDQYLYEKLLPGIETKPITAIWLRLGNKAARMAARTTGRTASYWLEPKASLVSLSYFFSDTSESNLESKGLG